MAGNWKPSQEIIVIFLIFQKFQHCVCVLLLPTYWVPKSAFYQQNEDIFQK